MTTTTSNSHVTAKATTADKDIAIIELENEYYYLVTVGNSVVAVEGDRSTFLTIASVRISEDAEHLKKEAIAIATGEKSPTWVPANAGDDWKRVEAIEDYELNASDFRDICEKFDSITEKPIHIRFDHGMLYAFGGELDTLRLLNAHRYNRQAHAGKSAYALNGNTHYFCMQLNRHEGSMERKPR